MQELSIDSPRDLKRPRLVGHARLQIDPLTGEPVLLSQEALITLNRSGSEILELCDGTRTLTEIVEELAERHPVPKGRLTSDVLQYVRQLDQKGLLQWT